MATSASPDQNHPNNVDVAPPFKISTITPSDDYPAHIKFRPPPVILTPRLLLREATLDDIPAIHAFLSLPETMKYMRSNVSETLEDTKRWYQARFDKTKGADPDALCYMIFLRDGDKEGMPIGTCGTRRPPQLGYQIGAGPDFWGKGYGGEAIKAFCDGIMQTIVEEKQADWEKAYIRIEVEARNVGSVKVAGKAGGVKYLERIEEQDNKLQGLLVHEYRVWAKDWTPPS